ncbi:Hypothetical_protein [Hexamita inflata]|uniref:Hypothetical_protein n=1 Tax=Hexamita inflata TaxID=28002 RepID=A0AA86PJL4_9EUKA|nr:Hypothetical protein HINF_LOCUS27147 [Hexamita inflata]
MQLMDEMTPERMIVQLKLSLQISMEKQNQYLLQIEKLQQELLQHSKLSKNEQLTRTVKNAITLQNDLNIQKDQCDQLRLQLEQQFVQSNALHKLHKIDLKTIEGQLLQIQQIELQKENQINELNIQLNKQESQIKEFELDKQRLALQLTQNENNYTQQIQQINQINENQLSQFKNQQLEQSLVLQVKISDLQNQITEYTAKLEQNLQQSVLLKEESKQHQIQLSQQNIQVQDIQNENQALKLQLAQLQTELAQNKNTMISMESTLLSLRNENAFLQSELSENDRSFKQTINQQKNQFIQLQTDLESKITLLNAENESLNNNITNLNNQLITSNNKTSELQNDLNISKSSLKDLTIQLQIIKNDNSLQITTVTELQTEQQQNQSIINSLHEQLESKTLQINELIRIQQQNLINIQTQNDQELKTAQNQLQAANNNKIELDNQIKQLKIDLDNKHQTLQNLNEQIIKLNESIYNQNESITELKQMNKLLTTNNQISIESLNNTKTELNTFKSNFASLNENYYKILEKYQNEAEQAEKHKQNELQQSAQILTLNKEINGLKNTIKRIEQINNEQPDVNDCTEMLFMKCRELTFDENQSQLIDGVINTIMEFITEIKGYKFLVTNQKMINILLKAVNAQKEYNYQFRLVPDLIWLLEKQK